MQGSPRARPDLPGDIRVRSIRADDWERLRDLRIAALTDTPIGFLETAEEAASCDEASWRRRAAGHAAGTDSVMIVAETPAGRWVGMLGAVREQHGTGQVFAVFVRPEARGGGVLEAMLTAVESWAREAALQRLRLYVHEDNPRARAAYRRLGFVDTGAPLPYPPDPSRVEQELAKSLLERSS